MAMVRHTFVQFVRESRKLDSKGTHSMLSLQSSKYVLT